uniref:Uncharacterized protein n=1 Tax=Rhizophora mucronata TaxID=61149 RepID=A0A2P2IHC2_RHIMU
MILCKELSKNQRELDKHQKCHYKKALSLLALRNKAKLKRQPNSSMDCLYVPPRAEKERCGYPAM